LFSNSSEKILSVDILIGVEVFGKKILDMRRDPFSISFDLFLHMLRGSLEEPLTEALWVRDNHEVTSYLAL